MLNWTHKVVKRSRGANGEWFRHRAAATFLTREEAETYAASFRDEQRATGVAGHEYDVVSRREVARPLGRGTVLATYRLDGSRSDWTAR